MVFPYTFYIHILARQTNGLTDGWTNGQTHPLIEMRGRILKGPRLQEKCKNLDKLVNLTLLLNKGIFSGPISNKFGRQTIDASLKQVW